LRNGIHSNNHLQNAFDKYGPDSFEPHVLEEALEDMLDIRERSWIVYYKSNQEKFGYNLSSGGFRGGRHSEESKTKIALARKGKPLSTEIRQKMSNAAKGKTGLWMKGRKLPEETRSKMSDAHKGDKNHFFGKHHSEKTKTKLSVSQMGKIISIETRLKMSKARMGKPVPDEVRRRMSAGRIGMRFTEEHKRNISIARMRMFNKTRKEEYET